MNNFKIIYKILRYLEATLDCECLDVEPISAERLGITRTRWEQVLIMMQGSGYITGIVTAKDLVANRRRVTEPIRPELTIKGLEYLAENSFMKKAEEALKTLGEFIP